MKTYIQVKILVFWTCAAVQAGMVTMEAAAAQTFEAGTTGTAPQKAVQVTPAFINEMADELLTNTPAMRAAAARTNAAGAAIGAVRTWEDPMARLGGMIADQEMRAEDGDLVYGIEQKLPLFGKPKRARNAARAEFAVEEARANFTFQILRRDLAIALFKTALAEEVVEIGRQDLAWLGAMVQTVESRYHSGGATLAETLTLQNERARRATALKTDEDRLDVDRVGLNRLLNRDLQAPWPSLRLPELANPIALNQKLVEFALKYEPRLSVLRREVDMAEANLEVTRRARYPDINAGVEARNYTGDGSYRQGMVFLSMNLPWFNRGKYRSEIQRDHARVQANRFERADYELELREELHRLVQRIDSARREALLYEQQVIPRSHSALESARAGWESGRNPLRDMLDARRMLLEAQLMRSRAVAEQYELLSDLVLCCGLGDLEALEMIGAAPKQKESQP